MFFARGKLVASELSLLVATMETTDGAAILGGTSGVIVVEASTGIGVILTPVTAAGGYIAGGILVGHGAITIGVATASAIKTIGWLNAHHATGAEKTTHNDASSKSDGGGSGEGWSGGGGKNAQHKNLKAKQAAEIKYNEAKTNHDNLRSKPNKSKADSKLKSYWENQMKHWKKKMDETGENHSMKSKG